MSVVDKINKSFLGLTVTSIEPGKQAQGNLSNTTSTKVISKIDGQSQRAVDNFPTLTKVAYNEKIRASGGYKEGFSTFSVIT